MIDLSSKNEWQHIDPATGLLFPWYTKSFLDELATWELKDKHVLEFGMGASSLWWQRKAAYLTAFDSNREWYNAVVMAMESKPGDEHWVESVSEIEDELMEFYDIAVVDIDPVEWRDECTALAIESLKPGGTLIIDNWDQPSVWVPCEETRALLAPYETKVYRQEGHPDWQTATFKI
jgi:predicted O-methyltransferase YrrM